MPLPRLKAKSWSCTAAKILKFCVDYAATATELFKSFAATASCMAFGSVAALFLHFFFFLAAASKACNFFFLKLAARFEKTF